MKVYELAAKFPQHTNVVVKFQKEFGEFHLYYDDVRKYKHLVVKNWVVNDEFELIILV